MDQRIVYLLASSFVIDMVAGSSDKTNQSSIPKLQIERKKIKGRNVLELIVTK